LENLVNQAALRAAVEGADRVFKKHLDFARDKVIMGPERKSKIPDDETNLITAYHEGGHAIVAHYTKDAHPLHKVSHDSISKVLYASIPMLFQFF